MKNQRLDLVLLLIGLSAVGAFFFSRSGRLGQSTEVADVRVTAVELGEEGKAFVDQQIKAAGLSNCADVPKLLQKIIDLETKMEKFTFLKQALIDLEKERKELDEIRSAQGQATEDKFKEIRNQEMGKLKREIIPICMASQPSIPQIGNPPVRPRGQ